MDRLTKMPWQLVMKSFIAVHSANCTETYGIKCRISGGVNYKCFKKRVENLCQCSSIVLHSTFLNNAINIVLIASLLGTSSALNNCVGKLPKMGYDSIHKLVSANFN